MTGLGQHGPIGLREAADRPLAEVGGKARALSQLLRDGHPVPAGFVLPPSGDLSHPAVGPMLQGLGDGLLAVRSSGVAEDGADLSMAGRFRSILQVTREGLADAVADCRAHAATVEPDGPMLPLIVQRMVPARSAGVVFSADPVTGQRDRVVIRAVNGLGDQLVSGQATGEEWTASGHGRAARTRSTTTVLSRSLARRVVAACRTVADRAPLPVDIEWAWDGRTLWLLQARPITGLPPAATWDPPAAGVFHRGFRFGEWIPDPVSRLFDTWALPRMESRLHEVHGQQFGQVAPMPHHVTVNGWYFYSLAFLPVPGLAARRSAWPILRQAFADPRRVAAMLPPTVRFGWAVHEREWREELLPRYRATSTDAVDRVEAASPAELVGLVDELCDLIGEYFASISVVAGSAYKLESALATRWQRHAADVSDQGHMVLLQGLDADGSGADAVGLDGAVGLESIDWIEQPLAPRDPTVGRQQRQDAKRRRDAAEQQAMAAFRTTRSRRRFERLLHDVQLLVRAREVQVAELGRPWPALRRAIVRLGDALVDAGQLAEPAQVFHLSKDELDQALGATMADDRRGNRQRDDQRDDPGDLSAIADRRRQQRTAAARLVPPQMLGDPPLMVRVVFGQTRRQMGGRRVPGALVVGDPASAGRASGPVRIVRGPRDVDLVAEGDVVVARLTTPAWMPLLVRAAAIVTDVGSALAHASITARELGIPAVVGTGDATRRLQDGQRVVVDGTRGVVLPSRTGASGASRRRQADT